MATKLIKLHNGNISYAPITLAKAVQYDSTTTAYDAIDALKSNVALLNTSVNTVIEAELANGSYITMTNGTNDVTMDVKARNGNTTSTQHIKGDGTKIETSFANNDLTITHKTTGTAGNYGESADKSIGSTSTSGGQSTFKIPYITTDSTGHVTASEKTITLNLPDLSAISGLEGAMHFIGFATAALTDGQTTDPTVTGHTGSFVAGDVVAYGDKEYVKDNGNPAAWHELGDVSAKANKTLTITAGDMLNGGGTLENDITINHDTVTRTDGTKTTPGSDAVTVLTNVTSDAYGHVTGVSYTNVLTSHQSLDNYVTKTNISSYISALDSNSPTAGQFVSGATLVDNNGSKKLQLTYANIPAATVTSIVDDNAAIDISTSGTTYTVSHNTGAGYKHIPANGDTGDVLVYGGTSGTASWGSISAPTTSIPNINMSAVSSSEELNDSLFGFNVRANVSDVTTVDVVTSVSAS